MRVVLQTVLKASCVVCGNLVSKIENGYLLFVGFTETDNLDIVEKMALKIKNLRINEDENGKINNALKETDKILSISQFTLYADTRKGNRPSFTLALEPTKAKELYLAFNIALKNLGLTVEVGIFQEDMKISLVNSGPKTFILEL